MSIYKKILIAGLLLAGLSVSRKSDAQTANKLIGKGNKQYKNNNFTDAEADYKKALQKNKKSTKGLFNLGNSLYQQKRYKEAYGQYAASEKAVNDKSAKADAHYNMGNTFMAQKDWKSGIQSYEQALKLNPQDDEARYNLAYAKEMLKKQNKGGGGNNNKNNKNKQNKNNKNQQNKNQNNKDKNNQNKSNQNKDQQNKDQKQHPQPQPSKLSKQEAQRLLQALSQQEKKLQDKAHKGKGIPAKVDKDW